MLVNTSASTKPAQFFSVAMSCFFILIVLGVSSVFACNRFEDYCDLGEEDEFRAEERLRRSVNASERAAVADAVTETLDHIFDESQYNAKIRPPHGHCGKLGHPLHGPCGREQKHIYNRLLFPTVLD